MKRTVMARSYPGITQRSRSLGGMTGVTIDTAPELPSLAGRMQNAHAMAVVDLEVFMNAYRKGAECAECLCRQVLGGPDVVAQVVNPPVGPVTG